MPGRKDNGGLEAEKQQLAFSRQQAVGRRVESWPWIQNRRHGWYSTGESTAETVRFFLVVGGEGKDGNSVWKNGDGSLVLLLLCIHLSLRINKGNFGWFFPVGLLADGRGERSDAAELRGAEITLKRTRQITGPVWESLVVSTQPGVKLQLPNRMDGVSVVTSCCLSFSYFSSLRSGLPHFYSWFK